MKTLTGTTRTVLAHVAFVGLFASSCSSGADVSGTETAATSAEATATTATATTVASTAELITIDAAEGPTESYVSSALGGLRFEAPVGLEVRVNGDFVSVTVEGPNADNSVTEAFVSLTSMLASGAKLSSTDAYLETLNVAGVDVSPTGTTIDLLGYRLAGYETQVEDTQLALFAQERYGAPSESWWGGAPGANRYFVGDTPSGVLVAGVVNMNGPADDVMPILGQMIGSMEFTGDGLDPALPPGETIEFAGVGKPPTVAETSDGAPPPLGEPFTVINPGRYELLNFGLPLSVSVPDGWSVQPNFPGLVILTATGSLGPSDRDLVWFNDIREFAPIAGGPVRAGDALSIDQLLVLLNNPEPGRPIGNVERYELVANDGTAMPVVRFEVEVDPMSHCTRSDPCDYGLINSEGFVKPLTSTVQQRVWLFPEHPSGVAAAVAQAPRGSAWFDEANTLMQSMELRSIGGAD